MRPLLVAALLLTACPAPTSDDAGTPDDAGSPDAGAGDAGIDVGTLEAGAVCLVANDLCAPGLVCAELYAEVGARCWPTCEGDGACAGRDGAEGQCVIGPDGAYLCAITAGNLERCGDTVSARCAPEALCAFLPGEQAGYCVIPCAPDEPTTCANEVEGAQCGCTAPASDCSVEGIRLADPLRPDDADAADGVCIPPTTLGDACGHHPTTGGRTQCSPGQRCDAEEGAQGTCQPAP